MPRKRSGLKASGSGYSAGSRDNALRFNLSALRVRVVSAAGMGAPYVHVDHRPRRNEVAVVLIICYRRVRQAHRRYNMPPDQLLDEGAHVGQFVVVSKLGESVGPDDGVELLLSGLLIVRMHGRGEEEGLHQGMCL